MRARRKETFVIQSRIEREGRPSAWQDEIHCKPLTSTADALKYIRDELLEGTYRIIAVKRTVKTVSQTVTKVTVADVEVPAAAVTEEPDE